MFPGCLQDFSRMFSGCSDGSYWPGGIWWSFQMKLWTLKIQRNPMIPNYSMIPAAAIRWSPAIRWSIRSMDFDNPKVYSDTAITDGLVSFCNSYFAISSQESWKICVFNRYMLCRKFVIEDFDITGCHWILKAGKWQEHRHGGRGEQGRWWWRGNGIISIKCGGWIQKLYFHFVQTCI